MFPINDTEKSRYSNFPFMTIAIILVNILVLVAVGNNFQTFQLFGTTPTLVVSQQGGGAISSITHIFLHGGIFHLLSNMLALWVFGRRVEDVCGPWRFLGFYLVCGLTADIVSTVTRLNSDVPGIGASGALYGVMAAYLMLFPKGRIRIIFLYWFLPIFNMDWLNGLWMLFSFLFIAGYIMFSYKGLFQSILYAYFPTPRAYLVILYFVLLEVPRALEVLVLDIESPVGHWAHLGGFFGGLFIFFFLRPDAFHRYRNELPL
ncbi:MAG: rhomboid family intramembrane serine protease [Chloroflexi bacterium]|nr:rhomboid family intramembrane serine protease [Chloroflexota bacterium]